MTHAYTYDVPIDEDFYRKIRDGLGAEIPEGLITHMAWKLPEGGGLRYVDVWRSERDAERFVAERLHPVVHPLLEEAFGVVPPEPDHMALEVIDVWGDAGAFV